MDVGKIQFQELNHAGSRKGFVDEESCFGVCHFLKVSTFHRVLQDSDVSQVSSGFSSHNFQL